MNDRHLSSGFDEVVEQVAIWQAVCGEQLWNARDVCAEGSLSASDGHYNGEYAGS